MNKLNTKIIARAGITAALYIALTLLTGQFSYSEGQIRLAESLSILPIFFAEAPIALLIGCMLANILSAYGVYDIFLGSMLTYISALLTKIIYKKTGKFFPSALPPIIINAIGVPLIFFLAGGVESYFLRVLSIALTQAVVIYGLGLPIYFKMQRLKERGSRIFIE